MKTIEFPKKQAQVKAMGPDGKEVVVGLPFAKWLRDICEGGCGFEKRDGQRVANKILDKLDALGSEIVTATKLALEDDEFDRIKRSIAEGQQPLWIQKVIGIYERFGYFAAVESVK